MVFTLAVTISIANLEILSKKIYARRQTLILFLASLFLAFGSIEACIRIADPLGISYYKEASRYHLEKIAAPELVYRHRPSWQTTYQGVEVRFNEHGLRDNTIQPKSRSEYRILVLGDSLTFGWGVAQGEIFTLRLQQMLAAKLRRPIRVVNTGVGSYNTVQQYTYLEKEGLSLDPDLVLLVYVSNDIEINEGLFDPWSARAFKDKSAPQVLLMLLWKSWLYRLVNHVYQYGSSRVSPGTSYDSVKGSQGWKASIGALKNIVDVSHNYGIPLVIFYFRWQATPFESALLEDVRTTVAPIPVEDISKWFANKQLHRYINSKVDSHPNSEGHKVIAENIASYLLHKNFFARITRHNSSD